MPAAMGRLDDHAKRRIVELRRAGLSFRKIKKVLELDGIRVTPQAVYLFLKRRSVEPGPAAASWDGDQPWPPRRGHEAEPPEPTGTQAPATPGGDPAGQDTKEGTQGISVAALRKDGRRLGEALPAGLPPGVGRSWLPAGVTAIPCPGPTMPGKGLPISCRGAPEGPLPRLLSLSLAGDDGSTGAPSTLGSCPAPGGPDTPPQPLPSRGRVVALPARSPALMVKRRSAGRAMLLQKKVGCPAGEESPSALAGAARRDGPPWHPAHAGCGG